MQDHVTHIARTFKYRIYPTKGQTVKLEQTLEVCREIYNAALQERRDAWKLNRVQVTYFDQAKQLTELKSIREDLKEFPSVVLRDPLKRIQRSFSGFFRRVKAGSVPGYPRFKGAARYNSFTFVDAKCFALKTKLSLFKIGEIRIKLHRPLLGNVKTLTITREGSKWFACFSVRMIASPLASTGQSVGVDVGIESFATLSDGTHIKNWRHYEAAQKQLRIAGRRVARRMKGSNRRGKAVTMLGGLHKTVANQRRDFQHKLSTDLIRRFDLIAVEDLNVAGLIKGNLSKQISDVAWSDFIHKLTYKAESAGRQVVKVRAQYTSQDCSMCGERVKKPLSQRQHSCVCGAVLHRDHNAALNILRLGLSRQELTCRVAESVS